MTGPTKPVLLALALVGVLAAAGPASALYVMTPLRFDLDRTSVDVGDDVPFRIRPEEGTDPAEWAGKTVRVRYTWDTAEGQGGDPDASTSSSTMTSRTLLDALVLDDAARGSFTWTVPEEVRDRNVDVVLESEDGEPLAFAWLVVGDAPPQMRILAGSQDDGREPAPIETDDGAGDAPSFGDDAERSVPATGALALGAVLALAAVAYARRR